MYFIFLSHSYIYSYIFSAGKSFAVIAYNPLAHVRTEWLRLPIPANRKVAVFDFRGAAIASSVTPVYNDPSLNTLVFGVTVPALGHSTVFVNFTGTEEESPVQAQEPVAATETIENGIYRISFDTATGLATSVTDLRSGKSTAVCVE